MINAKCKSAMLLGFEDAASAEKRKLVDGDGTAKNILNSLREFPQRFGHKSLLVFKQSWTHLVVKNMKIGKFHFFGFFSILDDLAAQVHVLSGIES